MKNLKNIFALILSLAVFSSCQMSEEITLTDDGSGKISFEMDGNGIMQMMGSQMKGKNGKPIKLDTLIVMKELLTEFKDSIEQLDESEQIALKNLKNFSLEMDMDSKGGTMNMKMYSDFKNVDQINNVFSSFQKASELAMKRNNPLGAANQKNGLTGKANSTPKANIVYFYNGKRFKRTTEIENYEDFKKEIDSSMSMVKGMFGTSKYTLKFHFPKKIKSASIKDAMYSQDGKTLIIEKGLIDYMTDPRVFDIEVEF